MGEITRTRSYVVQTRAQADAIAGRAKRYELLAGQLRDQLAEQHAMLIVALAELAVERGSNDRQYFIRRWVREYRTEPDPPWLRRVPKDSR